MRATAQYPIALALHRRACLVVGGGRVAQQKVKTLIAYGGRVTVVSPAVTPVLRRLARRGIIRWRRRTFQPRDVAGQSLVYGATDDPRTQSAVFRAAQRRRVLVNIVDQPALCTFFAMAQVKRGDLTIAVTTGGRAPGVAKRARQDVERVIGLEYGTFLRLLERVRRVVRQRVPTAARRKQILNRVIYGGVLEQLQRKRPREAIRRAEQLLRRMLGEAIRL